VVGDIHEILDQQIYADPKKASLDNTRIVAGLESTHTIYKTSPALVIGFDEREIAYKVLTTMHNRNHNKSRVQDLLAKNYVLMRRFDDNCDAIDSDPLPTHFDTLNFVSVSDYKWDPKPSYIQLDKHIL
jgi:hypothetical protein